MPLPAQHIQVEVYDPDGNMMGAGTTNENGRYNIEVNFGLDADARPVRIRVISEIKLPFGTKARVLPARGADPYEKTGELGGNPEDREMVRDLRIGLDEGSAAFHILTTIWLGLKTAREGTPDSLPDLDVLWAPGNGDTSSFQRLADRGELTVAGGIEGDLASNEDAWAEPHLMRLFGEYIFTYLLHETAPDGEATPTNLLPTAAWREGFLDFWACIARDSSIYWDTAGLGEEGRVIRYFVCENFFDPALGTLGPDDPNVYQPHDVIGITSAFTVAELLWDIHDRNTLGDDQDGIDGYPWPITMRLMREAAPGFSYPYLYTLLDAYTKARSFSPFVLGELLRTQGLVYPATFGNGLKWPPPISPPAFPGSSIAPPLTVAISDEIDSETPTEPINPELGIHTQRVFIMSVLDPFDITVTMTTTGDFEVQLLDLHNNLLASDTRTISVSNLPPRKFVVRVISLTNPQIATFDLDIDVRLSTNPVLTRR
ncbi:MAG: hypothetical protein ACYTGN_12460 [Planctomycetota bacterium]|jgi:hypothetical protein